MVLLSLFCCSLCCSCFYCESVWGGDGGCPAVGCKDRDNLPCCNATVTEPNGYAVVGCGSAADEAVGVAAVLGKPCVAEPTRDVRGVRLGWVGDVGAVVHVDILPHDAHICQVRKPEPLRGSPSTDPHRHATAAAKPKGSQRRPHRKNRKAATGCPMAA